MANEKKEPTVEVRIRHASFKYTDANGNHQVAQHGATVEIPESEYERGSKFNAFLEEGEEKSIPSESELTEITINSTDEEVVAFVKAASVDEISAFLATPPDEGAEAPNSDLAERILDAEAQAAKEQERKVRVGVEKAVEAAVSSRSQ